MARFKRLIDRERLTHLSHTHGFHTTHNAAHVLYFIAVVTEGHGLYAIVGGVMVVLSFITVVSKED